VQSVTVFSQATIADFAIAKDLFDVSEWMLHLGPGAGFELFSFQLTVVQFLTRAGASGNEPGDVFTIFMLIPLLNHKITGITEHALLVTVEKVVSRYDVMNVGRRGIDAVDQAERVINADVHLHAKVPLIAFSGLVHPGRSDDSVTFAALVLCGTRGRNDGSIHNATLA